MLPIGSTTQNFINIIPNTLIDDFFAFGFAGGLVGYAWFIFSTHDLKNHTMHPVTLGYGLIISGALGGLLAIVVDRSLELSILIGLLNQIIFLSITRATAKGTFWPVLKEIIIKLLTAGTGGKP